MQSGTERGIWPAFRTNDVRNVALISAILLVPCIWHRHIEAGDLGSHLYNAWLAQLIQTQHLPGLWIAHQHYNVLFDLLLSRLAKLFNFDISEKVAVWFCVLIFFWGAFALASTVIKRPAWSVAPVLAMVAYGWTFHVGFFNYYLSIGIGLWALAIFWRGKSWERLAAVGLALLALIAHPMGFAWVIGALAYVWVAQTLPNRRQWLLLGASGIALFLVRWYVASHDVVYGARRSFYYYNGADQLVVFGSRYAIPAVALCLLFGYMLLREVRRTGRDSEFWAAARIPVQLYLCAELAILLLPDYVHWPMVTQPVSVIIPRLTLVSAVLGGCILACLRPRRWELAAQVVVAAVFFGFLFQDTGKLARMETQIGELVNTLPFGARVLGETFSLPGSRTLTEHLIDRECIGHCFSYANYEPASGQFRVRAAPDNPFVNSTMHFTSEASLHAGKYTIDAPPLPAYRIHRCASATGFCISPVVATDTRQIPPP